MAALMPEKSQLRPLKLNSNKAPARRVLPIRLTLSMPPLPLMDRLQSPIISAQRPGKSRLDILRIMDYLLT
jgi:hypothetical protein